MGAKSGRFIVIAAFFILVLGLSSTGKVAWAAPVITSPSPGSTLNCGNVTFSWSANGTSVDKWWLYVGTTENEKDILDSGGLGSSTSLLVSGIPEDGSTVYVKLFYKLSPNPWQNVKTTYTAASNCGGGGGGGSTGCPDAWDKQLTTDRFELVMGDEAVLDKETCLVWEQSPNTTTRTWTQALAYCFMKKVGGRKGWRLPTIEELATLVDDTQSNPALPSGHPFSNVQSSWYWSSTTTANSTANAWYVYFVNGNVNVINKGNYGFVWCVRGGQGHDAY